MATHRSPDSPSPIRFRHRAPSRQASAESRAGERDRRHIPLLIVLIAAAVAVVLLPAASRAAPAPPATPTPTVEEAQRHVDVLYEEAEQATERYNSTKIQAEQVQRELAGAVDKMAKQSGKVDGVKSELAGLAATVYRSRGGDVVLQVFFSPDPKAFLDRAATLDHLSGQEVSAFRRLLTEQQQLDQDRNLVAKKQGQLDAENQRMAEEKTQIEARLAKVQQVLSQLKAEERARVEAQERASRSTAPPVQHAQPGPPAQPPAQPSSGTPQAAPKTESKAAQPAPTPPAASPGPTGPAPSGRAERAVQYAHAQLGKPYRWGGAGPDAFDCSGLTMMAWRQAGVSLPHYTGDQWRSGKRVSQSELQPGDLVFWYSDLHHVGLYIGDGKVIHAPRPGKVVEIAPVSSMPYAGAVRP